MAAAERDERARSEGLDPRSTERLLDRVRRGIGRANAIPVVASEELEGDELGLLTEEVGLVLDECTDLLADVLAHYQAEDEAAPESSSSDDDDEELDWDLDAGGREVCGEVERRMGDVGGVGKITSVAYVARLGLRGRRQQVDAATPDRKWDLIATCSSAVREVLKSLSALELAICEHEDLPVTSRYWVSERERAVKIRRAYVTFRADVLGDGPPSQDVACRRLRTAASAIAKLTGRPAYSYARVHDRWQIRGFQARIKSLLTEHAKLCREPNADPRAADALGVTAARLWQDLANLTELILQINQRGELREHDHAVLHDAARRLAEGVDVDPTTALKDVFGRDPELDAAIAGRTRPTRDELGAVVARLLEPLSRGPQSDGPRSRRRTDAPISRPPSSSSATHAISPETEA